MLRLNRCLVGTFAITAAVLAAHATPSYAQATTPPDNPTVDGAAAAVAPPADDAAQVLQPGDLVRLRIWREPDLSGDFLVGTDGVVVFPLIGPRQVMDRSPDALKVELVEAYAEYLRNPSIEVLPLRRVNIYGAVQQAGLYPVDPTMTLYDALALAGGPTTNGDPDKVELVRDGERVKAKLARDTRIAELPIRSGDQLFVPERSWFSRNTGLVATMISATVSLIIAFGR